MSKVYRCRGCGELDSIVAVSLAPWIMAVRPREGDEGNPDAFAYDPSDDDVSWEGAVELGFGCTNINCVYSQDRHPAFARGSSGSLVITPGRRLPASLSEMAEAIDVP